MFQGAGGHILLAMQRQYEIGVIGAGNAAEGIVHGLLRKTVLLDDRIIASDPHEGRRKLFAERFKIDVTDDNRYVVENSFIVLLAVKPQQFAAASEGFADLVDADHLIVSIMAGIPTARIESRFPGVATRVVRAMPNLGLHVGAGMTGVHGGRHATEADLLRAQRIFEAGGRSVVIEDEGLMDAVTAVSGSGPAYFYYFAEALMAAGEAAGLGKQQAEILAKQTCLGAAQMMLESGDPPDVLRKKVTSAGGTTEAAIALMGENKVYDNIFAGVLAAWRRSQELGK